MPICLPMNQSKGINNWLGSLRL
uniref:Uncharacterized protein n=1 Tax=Lepeophtheirus salmonis TaxID=72036 RepID=A0A0K2VFS8_LEPSM